MRRIYIIYTSIFFFLNINSDLKAATDDAGVVSIDSISSRCPGNVFVFASVINFGTNAITSIQLNWEIDGVLQTPVAYPITIAAGLGAEFGLGITTFTAGVSHNFKAWTSIPNGVADGNTMNDTAVALGVFPAMSGTYTIGSGGDFANFSAASSTLSARGICGPVEIVVDPGTYTEHVIMRDVLNSSAVNTILFRSSTNDSSSVTLQWASSAVVDSNYTMKLEGMDYVTFQSITFSRTGTDVNSGVVELNNLSSNISFLNNKFEGPSSFAIANTTGTQSSIFCPGDSAWDGLIVRNNYFLNNSNGIWVSGLPTQYAARVVIEDNVFETFYVGVFLLYQNAPVIGNNIVTRNTTSSLIDFYGISLRYGSGVAQIINNKITGYTGSYGIRLRSYVCIPPDRALVANNFVQVGFSTIGRGVSIEENSTNIDVFHNSVNYTGASTTVGAAMYIEGATTADMNLLNNIFANSGGGYSLQIAANATTSLLNSDNNCFYTTGTKIGFFGADVIDLAALQAATSLDAHSVSGDPVFTTVSDLHTTAGLLGDAGSPLAGIATDIDGDARDVTHPDIGADEFTPVAISSLEDAAGFILYPNPATNCFTIDNYRGENKICTILLMDISGREVFRKENIIANRQIINLPVLTEGTYIVSVIGDRVEGKKLLVINR